MADDGLRALERRYRDTGAVDDHARWIAARVRVGELSEHRARLAADLGHAAARLAIAASASVRLAEVIKTLRYVCGATREPTAASEARWVLTGEPAPPSAFEEVPLSEKELSARIVLAAACTAHRVVPLEGEWRQGLERLEAWVQSPASVDELEPVWTPVLSREQVQAAVRPERAARAGQLLDRIVDAWREQEVQALAEAGVAAQPGEWPGFDLWWEYRMTYFDVEAMNASAAYDDDDDDLPVSGVPLLIEMARTARGAVMIACCAALHAPTTVEAVGPAVQGAVVAAGEEAVRNAVVHDVGPWLLREEP